MEKKSVAAHMTYVAMASTVGFTQPILSSNKVGATAIVAALMMMFCLTFPSKLAISDVNKGVMSRTTLTFLLHASILSSDLHSHNSSIWQVPVT